MNDYLKHGSEKAKSIKAKGLTFGADRKFGDNKFFGLALRYGRNKSNIFVSQQNTGMDSLTLNFYGIIPIDEDQYVNAVLGLSALRLDNKYLGKSSGERNGKQAFASLNYRTKNTYGKLNITPTGKFTYGVTRLSEFTDFLSSTIDLQLPILYTQKIHLRVENFLPVFYLKWINSKVMKEPFNQWER